MESLDIQAAIEARATRWSASAAGDLCRHHYNRGTRYRTHFVKVILDSTLVKCCRRLQPEVMDVIEDKGETFDLIQQE